MAPAQSAVQGTHSQIVFVLPTPDLTVCRSETELLCQPSFLVFEVAVEVEQFSEKVKVNLKFLVDYLLQGTTEGVKVAHDLLPIYWDLINSMGNIFIDDAKGKLT